MDWQTVNNMHVVKVGPSLLERLDRLIARQHHRAVVARLRHFRETLQADMSPEEPWTVLTAPLVLTLADICDALYLNEAEKAEVLGERGQNAVAEVLETHVTVRKEDSAR